MDSANAKLIAFFAQSNIFGTEIFAAAFYRFDYTFSLLFFKIGLPGNQLAWGHVF